MSGILLEAEPLEPDVRRRDPEVMQVRARCTRCLAGYTVMVTDPRRSAPVFAGLCSACSRHELRAALTMLW